MRQQLLRGIASIAACLAIAAQAQTPPGTTPGSTSPGATSPGSTGTQLDPTGRSSQQSVRASKLTGADVKSSQGTSLGQLEDVLISPTSGRVEFAVISYSSSGAGARPTTSATSPSSPTTPGSSATPGSPTTPGTPSSPGAITSSSTGGKLVPVPWFLLRPSGMRTPSAGSDQQVSFVFIGDQTKLDSSPSFDRSSWPDVSQPDFRQRVYSHFGMQPGPATGASGTPGGYGTSTGERSTPSPSTPSSPTTPPSSSSPNSPQPAPQPK